MTDEIKTLFGRIDTLAAMGDKVEWKVRDFETAMEYSIKHLSDRIEFLENPIKSAYYENEIRDRINKAAKRGYNV